MTEGCVGHGNSVLDRGISNVMNLEPISPFVATDNGTVNVGKKK